METGTVERRLTWHESHKKEIAERGRIRRKLLRDWYQELKAGLACVQCGENHPACLEFHHRDPSTKLKDVSMLVAISASRSRILAEIAKCDVLCSNCHRKLHWQQEAIPARKPVEKPLKKCKICGDCQNLQPLRAYCKTHWRERQKILMRSRRMK